MSIACYTANTLWQWAGKGNSKRFQHAAKQVQDTQAAYLKRIIRRTTDTRFGQDFAFQQIDSIRRFQERVPVSSYETFAPYVARICAGEQQVLTHEPVTKLTPTSGSTGETKLIPYTKSLHAEFQAGIAPWLRNVFLQYPVLRGGPAYWSVTPVCEIEASHKNSVVPIGFEDDSAYFGKLEQRFVNTVMAVPQEVARTDAIEAFRYATLRFLLAERDLRLISVWNPSFFTLLLDDVEGHAERIIRDIHDGTFTPMAGQSQWKNSLRRFPKKNPRRAKAIETILARGESPCWETLWPRLALISCWTDGWAAHFAEALQRLFPTTPIQGKGLLATEAFLSFPFSQESHPTVSDPVLSVNSHFFEFESLDDRRIYLAHELQEGAEYTVIVTTGGGLYRYRLGDQIKVTGFYRQCPRFHFLHREHAVSDLCGEKLHETHVAQALQESLNTLNIDCPFYFLAPEIEVPPPRYVLFIQQEISPNACTRLAATVDTILRSNYHYDYCRRLGQLAAVEVQCISETEQKIYWEKCNTQGQAGTTKFAMLALNSGWRKTFTDP